MTVVLRFLLIPGAIAFVLLLWTFFDVLQTERPRVSTKAVWLAAVLLLPLAGPLLWIGYGRPRRPRNPGKAPRGPVGPDDDPDFLIGL